MEGWYRGWLCYFPIVLVLFIVCSQILPTVKQQETVHLVVTILVKLAPMILNLDCILNGAVIRINGWILMATCPVPSSHVVVLYFLLLPASPRVRKLYVLSVACCRCAHPKDEGFQFCHNWGYARKKLTFGPPGFLGTQVYGWWRYTCTPCSRTSEDAWNTTVLNTKDCIGTVTI